MRRAAEKPIVSRPTTSLTPPAARSTRAGVVAELDAVPAPSSIVEPLADGPSTNEGHARQRGQLPAKIRKRIESRLAGRVRNLAVRISDDTVVLEGQCATYYTKQLAQHAALGILEDEHLDNAITVDVPR